VWSTAYLVCNRLNGRRLGSVLPQLIKHYLNGPFRKLLDVSVCCAHDPILSKNRVSEKAGRFNLKIGIVT
jgi:hypothetical protein